MKNKIKKLSALLCAVVVSCLSCIPAFAVDISNMSRKETQEYVHGTTSTYRTDVDIPKSAVENVANFLDLKNNKIPARIFNGELDVYGTRLENIVNSANCDLSDIVYDVFIFGNDEIISVYWIYYVKSETAKFTMKNYNSYNYEFKFNEKCFCSRAEYLYDDTTNLYKYTGASTSTVDYVNMANGYWVIPKDYTCYYYSNNAGTPAFDENGFKLDVNPLRINVDYEFKDGFHNFEVTSNKYVALQFDFIKYDYNVDYSEFFIGNNVDVKKFNPIFRVNDKYTAKFKGDNKKYTLNDMSAFETDDLKIRWWKDFFKNDTFALFNGRSGKLIENIEEALNDTDEFYNDTNETESGIDRNKNSMIKSYQNIEYVILYLKDVLYHTDYVGSSEEFEKTFIEYTSGKDHRTFSQRVRDYSVEFNLISGDYDNAHYYKSYIEHPEGTDMYRISDEFIDYEVNTDYIWLVTYQLYDDVGTEHYLKENLYLDFFPFYTTSHNFIGGCPYGDGISNDKYLIYDENNNVVGKLEDDIIIPSENKNDVMFEDTLDLNINSLDDLFNSSTSFFKFLEKGFSILPAFLWSLIGASIVCIIFLRVMGR